LTASLAVDEAGVQRRSFVAYTRGSWGPAAQDNVPSTTRAVVPLIGLEPPFKGNVAFARGLSADSR